MRYRPLIWLVATCVGLAASASAGTPAPAAGLDEGQAQAAVVTFHRHPDPERVEPILHALRGGQALNDPNGAPGMIGFFAGVFERYPDRVAGWLKDLPTYAFNEQLVLLQAVWLSDTPASRAYLARAGAREAAKIGRPDIVRGPPWHISQLALTDPLRTAVVWGHYWATGDAADVAHVIGALGRQGGMGGLASVDAARSLTWNAENDPAVLALCEAASARSGAAPVLTQIVRVANARGDPMDVAQKPDRAPTP